MKKLLFIVLLTPLLANAATLYCGPSSAGANNGTTVTDRIALPDTTGFVRGNVYVVIEGSYGNRTLSTGNSGSTTITIRYLNAAQDSGVGGYNSTLHDGQAVFGQINAVTGYWIVDGIHRTRGAAWTAPTGYGFRATDGLRASGYAGDNAQNSIFRYIDCGPNYTTTFSSGWGQPWYFTLQTGITISYCAIHNGVGTLPQGAGCDNLTIEYNDIGPGWGKEALRGGNGDTSSGWIVRHNRFWESTQTDPDDGSSGITAEIGMWDWTGTASGNAIYGNWFYNSKTGGRNAIIVVGGNGSSWVGGGADGTLVYNNTFAGIYDCSVFSAIDLNGASTVARNNLFHKVYERAFSANSGTDILTINTAFGRETHPYATGDARYVGGLTGIGTGLYYVRNLTTNTIYLYDSAVNASAGGATGRFNVTANENCYLTKAGSDWFNADTKTDNDTIMVDPFTAFASQNFRLTGATGPGTTLGSPYNVDMDGITRNVDGTWDVGAFEFDSGGDSFPSITVATPATPLITNNSSVVFSGTATDDVSYTVTVTNLTVPRGFTVSNPTSGTWSATVTNAVGTNSIQSSATDSTNQVTSVTNIVVYDATSPTLSITSPTNGVTYSSSTVTLSNSVSDAIGIASVNSTNTTTGVKITLNGAYTGTATLQAGANTLLTIAQDVAGNRTTNSVSVTYTAAAPPSAGGVITNLHVQILEVRP